MALNIHLLLFKVLVAYSIYSVPRVIDSSVYFARCMIPKLPPKKCSSLSGMNRSGLSLLAGPDERNKIYIRGNIKPFCTNLKRLSAPYGNPLFSC